MSRPDNNATTAPAVGSPLDGGVRPLLVIVRGSPVFHLLRGDETDMLTWCGQNQTTRSFYGENAKIVRDVVPGMWRCCKHCGRVYGRGHEANDLDGRRAAAWASLAA